MNPAETVSFAFASVSSGVVNRIDIDLRTDAGSRPALATWPSSAFESSTDSSNVRAFECQTSAWRAVTGAEQPMTNQKMAASMHRPRAEKSRRSQRTDLGAA